MLATCTFESYMHFNVLSSALIYHANAKWYKIRACINYFSLNHHIYNYDDEEISGMGLGVKRPFSVSGTGGLLSSGSDFL